MKKFFKGIVTAAAVLFASTSAFAAYAVDVTTEQANLFKIGCERAGAITFTFSKSSVLTVGDRWQVKLPPNVTLCKDIEYVIGDSYEKIVTFKADTLGADPAKKGVIDSGVAATTDKGITSATIDSSVTGGPVYGKSITMKQDAGADRPIWLYVVGLKDTNAVTIWVLGKNEGDTLTVGNNEGDKLVVRLFDGKKYRDTELTTAVSTFIMPDKAASTTAGVPVFTGPMSDDAPNLASSLCISIADAFSDNCVNVSYPSNAVADNTSIYQFSNDFNIGCIDPRTYSLYSCTKNAPETISLPVASQNGTSKCIFDYEGFGNDIKGYCAGYSGNRIIIQSNKTTFAQTGDLFSFDLESKTAGVYFNKLFTADSVRGDQDPCKITKLDATDITVGDAAAYTLTATGNAASPAFGESDGSTCKVPASNRIYKIAATPSANFAVETKAKYVWLDLPDMVYDTTDFSLENVEAKVTVTLNKVPCGVIRTFDVTLGSFVKVCGATTSSTLSLIYPFFPSINATDNDANWWAGIIVTNGSAVDGTATLVFSDKDGAQAKMTTPVIKAGGQYILGITPSILAGLTPVTGTFDGNKKYSVQAYATFTKATGFAIVGAPPAVSGGGPYKPYTSREF